MKTQHSLLHRQVKKVFGEEASIPAGIRQFISSVDEAYQEFDSDRKMLERSMDLSSRELGQANADMRAVFQAIPDLFIRLDKTGTILDFKAGSTNDLYLPTAKLIGKRIQNVPIQDVSHKFDEAIRTVRATARPAGMEYSLRLNGHEDYYEARLLPLLNSQIIVIIRNISERKRAEGMTQRLGRILEDSVNEIYIFDAASLNFVIVNEGARENLGYSMAELRDLTPVDLKPEFPRARFETLVEPLRQGKQQQVTFETIHKRKDGSTYPVEVRLQLDRISQPPVFVAIIMDITERRRTDEERSAWFERSRRQQAAITGLASDRVTITGGLTYSAHVITESAAEALGIERASIWMLDPDHSCLRCTDLFERSPQRHTHGVILQRHDYPKYFEALESALALDAHDAQTDPRTSEFTQAYLIPNSITSMLDASIRVSGQLIGVICHEHTGPPRTWTPDEVAFAATMAEQVALALMHDDRRRAGQLQRSRSAVLEQIALGASLDDILLTLVQSAELAETHMINSILLLDESRKHLRVAAAPSLPDFYNYAINGLEIGPAAGSCGTAAFTGKTVIVSDVMTHPFWQPYRELAARVGFRACWSQPIHSSTGEVLGTFATYLKESREPFPSELELIASCAQLASIAVERKQVELSLHQKEEQIRHAQKMEAVGRLAGGIAHDFNNLLTAILGYSRLILDNLEDQPMRADMDEIIHAAERAGGLTRQMLAFGRKQLAQVKSLDLNDVVQNMDRLLRRTIGDNIELVNRLEPSLDAVRGDAGHFEQVVLNLAINARDAMPNGGRLIVETRNVSLDDRHCRNLIGVTPGNYVMLRIEDTGFGMTDDVRQRAFEPFFTTKDPNKGSGMGLAMVYGIVHQFRGAIELNSNLGVGTEFKLYFPRSAEPAERYSPPADNEALRGVETVLVAEDAESVRRLTVRILRSLGYTVLHAGNGKEALHVSKKYKGPIHLLLTDLMMPHIGGHDLAVRLLERRPEMKVLYTSGFSPGAVLEFGIAEHITPFIPKPFTREGLAQKVREVLAGGSAGDTTGHESREAQISN